MQPGKIYRTHSPMLALDDRENFVSIAGGSQLEILSAPDYARRVKVRVVHEQVVSAFVRDIEDRSTAIEQERSGFCAPGGG